VTLLLVTLEPCLNGCSKNGKCIDGACYCAQGFRGADCSHKDCPTDCMGNGACKDGTCLCKPGWGGIECANSTFDASCAAKSADDVMP
jgi:hypothetical protein